MPRVRMTPEEQAATRREVVERAVARIYAEMQDLRAAIGFAEECITAQMGRVRSQGLMYPVPGVELGPGPEAEAAYVGDVIGSLFWRSFFVAFYSQFEAHLDMLCRELRDSLRCQIKLRDLKGTGITRSSLFLTKVVGIRAPVDDTWKAIASYAKVRNAIAHAGGIVGRDEAKAVVDILARSGGRLDTAGLVHLGPRTIEDVVRTFDSFWRELERGL